MIKLTPIIEDSISKILQSKRREGKVSGMWKFVGIPYMIKLGFRNKLHDWEKEWFDSQIGIRWNSKGNQINSPTS